MSGTKRDDMRARVQASSKDEVVLEEMIRRGFWREGEGAPSLPADLIKRQGEIRRELDALAKDASAYEDSERALKRIQIERMKAARERRVETKRRHAEARYVRAKAWHERQSKEVTHLGDSVSAALNGAAGKPERIAQLKLPPLADPTALAAAMGIKIGELRFLAYDRAASRIDHYSRFTIPKKSGGVREISAPMPRLKRAQYWVLKNLLEPLALHEASHGFRAKRSILTNARPHVRQRVVINMDLRDFFPSISYPRVKGFFLSLGYPEKIASPLALICTDAERDKLAVDGSVWSVARGPRRLPQGAPTSPHIANLIAAGMDRRMTGAAKALGFTYTRYADDMTFSGKFAPGAAEIDRLLWQVREIAHDEGFVFNDKKTRVMGSGTRQDVTGLVVNSLPAVAREERRRFRAWLHKAEAAARQRTEIPPWINGRGATSDALGFASYLAMIDKEHGAPLVARTKAVFAGARTAAKPQQLAGRTSRDAFRKASGEGRAPYDTWWIPADRTAPKLEPIATPKPVRDATSVPPTGASARPSAPAAANPWAQRGNAASQPRTTRAPRSGVQPSTPSEPATPAPKLWQCLALSLFVLPLIAIPVGLFIVVAAWFFIWRAYRRGRWF